MRLRPRLALSTVAVAMPLLAVVSWGHRRISERASNERMADSAFAVMTVGGERARCEADPQSWLGPLLPPMLFPKGEAPGPRLAWVAPQPGPEGGDNVRAVLAPRLGMFAYDGGLRRSSLRAPELNPSHLARLDRGGGRAAIDVGAVQVVVVRMPWTTGPCAVVAAVVPPEARELLPPLELWLAPLLAVVSGLLLSMGPLVRRIRDLTREVTGATLDTRGVSSVRGDDEIVELAHAFAAAQREIGAEHQKAMQREKSLRDFVANTTHDLMIPLSALQGHLAALEPQQRDAAAGELASAARESHYIGSLLSNLAGATRLESAGVELARDALDLGALLGRVVSRHAALARQHQVELGHAVPPEPITVFGELTLIEQAVSNVIANAILHNRRGGHVAAVLDQGKDARFKLVVLDDGPGVDVSELSQLAERGFRGHRARSRAPSGQGLGLAITREVALLHEWAMELRRSEAGGLEVELSGPAHDPAGRLINS